MTKKKTAKCSLIFSALSLLMCISMLIGSTFAWFTDSVSSKKNIIAAGNLDVEMYHSNATVKDEKVDSTVTLFNNLNGEAILWEPGVVSYENLRIVNKGDLALSYCLYITTENENFVIDPSGEEYGLSQVLKIGFVEGGITASDRETVVSSVDAADWTTLSDFLCSGSLLPKGTGSFEETWGVVVYWEPSVVDNRWNLNNGKTLSEGDVLSIDLGVHLTATQEQFESDSFGSDYDADAVFPAFYNRFRATAKVNGKVDANNQLTEDITIGNKSGRMHAVVPKGTVLEPGTTKLILTVNTTNRSNNIEMTQGQVSRSLDVHIKGIAENNAVPATVDLGAVMPKGLKNSSIQIYHVEDNTPAQMSMVDTLTAHNQFIYNADNGEMTVSMATFSEVTAVVAVGNPWSGERDTSWYKKDQKEFTISTAEQFAGLGAIVGGMVDGIEQDDFSGKTVKLDSDINLGGNNGKVWYPIGYYNNLKSYERQTDVSVTSNVSSFEGIFDGQNHTITNIYQNTWEMFGDYNSGYSGTPNYYKDGMGIFGFVMNGTIKNLTVDNFQSDGEFCTTGCVAAYISGTSTFENITVTNSNPRAYNVPNGGVVGYAYAESKYTNVIDFTNINIDSSNKITALWGSWDVGCGGILGRVNGDTTINMTNCEVGAEIDVYNDVCGNYQYYQYRYAGMLIGTVGPDGDPKSGPEKVNFSNVKVYIGNWADYYYCEFEKNSQGSYTDDFQFSRVEKNEIVFDDSTNLPKSCTHNHTANEDKLAVYLPFNQLYTGYGWGASPELITVYGKEVNGVTVERSFYSVTYMTADGKDVLAVEYVTDGERSDSKLWANEYKISRGAISTPAGSNTVFKYWVNSGSVKVTSISAGNRDNIILYESWTNPYIARFVDQFGNVIHTATFTEENRKISDIPKVPEVEDCIGVWEDYSTALKNATGDITIRPIYTYAGKLKLTPVDEEPIDGIIDYYKVEAVADLDETTYIPGYFNGLPVKVVEKLYKNDNNWDFGADVKTIIIGEGVEELKHNSLAYTSNLDTVKLPSTITLLDKNVFSRNTYGDKKKITIEYNGTMAEWKAIQKHDDWANGLQKVSYVKCIDGEFRLEDSGILGLGSAWKEYPNS